MAIIGDIERAYGTGMVHIYPFNKENVNPNSYNVRIDTSTLVRHNATVMRWGNQDYVPVDDLWLYPNEFYLASTVEEIGSEHYAPMLEGRSTIARHGVSVHVTAGFGDIGYTGHWTLELTVAKPIQLLPNMIIAQVAFFVPDRVVKIYNGNYRYGTIFAAGELNLA